MQVCTLLQTDNHASTPPLCFLQAGCPSCRPTNSVKALKAQQNNFGSQNSETETWFIMPMEKLVKHQATLSKKYACKQYHYQNEPNYYTSYTNSISFNNGGFNMST